MRARHAYALGGCRAPVCRPSWARGEKTPLCSTPSREKIVTSQSILSEQRRIVEILDRFDTLTNSISEGLPREIALRRKQ